MVILHMRIEVFFPKVYSIYLAWCMRCHGVERGLSGKSQQYKNGVDRPARQYKNGVVVVVGSPVSESAAGCTFSCVGCFTRRAIKKSSYFRKLRETNTGLSFGMSPGSVMT